MNNLDFEKIIEYSFQDKSLLDKALTHSSYCREHGVASKDSNERLEFLGDAFFDAVISEELYKRLEKVDEGKLTKTRALIVCEKSLASVAQRLGVGNYLNLGKGEEQSGGRKRESILADALEAIVAAIYLDGGMDAAKDFINRFVLSDLEDKQLFYDSKTHLQELIQGKLKKEFRYVLLQETGPEHDKVFEVEVQMENETIGQGSGRTKKAAEQQAAYNALRLFRDKGVC